MPGVRIGDHLPRIARIMDRLTVVRSLTHPYPLHGTVYATTGIPEVDTKIEAIPRHQRQWPFIGSVVDYLDDQKQGGALPEMPRNIALPFVMGSKNEYPPLAGPYGAMLGTRYDPVYTDFTAAGHEARPRDPARSSVQRSVPRHQADRQAGAGRQRPARAADRRRTVRPPAVVAGAIRPGAPRAGSPGADQGTFSQHQQTAFALLTTGKLHDALDYTREPSHVREAYGMTLFGQSCLAARRLVEAGTKFVTVIWDAYGLNAGSWDTHHNHFPRLKDFLLPVFDQAFSALILDLEQRGLLDETLVLVISEHGRTPQIDRKAQGGGRDHWSRAYSQVYAGGGMGRGNVVGATDKLGGDVVETADLPERHPRDRVPPARHRPRHHRPRSRRPAATDRGHRRAPSRTARMSCRTLAVGF